MAALGFLTTPDTSTISRRLIARTTSGSLCSATAARGAPPGRGCPSARHSAAPLSSVATVVNCLAVAGHLHLAAVEQAPAVDAGEHLDRVDQPAAA